MRGNGFDGMAVGMALLAMLAVKPAISESIVTRSPLRQPRCVDTAVPDPTANLESMPVHVAIADFLMDDRAPNRFTCVSARFSYTGTRSATEVRVTSHYRRGRKLHAEQTYVIADAEKNLKRHGIMKAFWPGGAPQSLEYFCNGFEAGFHRYFDEGGELIAVVDFSKGDYAYSKAAGGDVHKFFDEENSRHSSMSSPMTDAQRFREAYRIENGVPVRAAFAIGNMHQWRAVDPTLQVKDWVTPGATTWFQDRTWRLQIVNREWDYQSFAAIYQRDRRNLVNSPIRAANDWLLACPWIDEAMSLGVEDPRFKLAEVADSDSPTVRAMKCLDSPDTDCLLRAAYDANRQIASQLGGDLKPLARIALATGRAELAREVMERTLGDTRGYKLPNPLFAEALALRAKAERALSLGAAADKSFAEALDWAAIRRADQGGTQDPYALVNVGMLLARDGQAEAAKRAYRDVAAITWVDSTPLRREIAAAISRQGELLPAKLFLDSSAPVAAAAPAPSQSSPGLSAIVQLAQAQLARNDRKAGRESFVWKAEYADPRSGQLSLDLLLARTRVGEPLDELIANWAASADVAAYLCDHGMAEQGREFLARAGKVDHSVVSPSISHQAAVAYAKARCGDVLGARAMFRRELQRAAKLVDLPSDEIGESSSDVARRNVMQRIVDAQFFDELPADRTLAFGGESNGQFEISLALARARAGGAAEGLAILERLPEKLSAYPEWRFPVTLARAEIFALLGRSAESTTEFAAARSLALAATADTMKVNWLAQVALTYLRLSDQTRAQELLAVTLPAVRRAAARRDHFTPSQLSGVIPALAYTFALAGNDATANSLITRDSSVYAPPRSNDDDLLHGELARAALSAGALGDAAQNLRAVESPAARVLLLAQTQARHPELAKLWNDALANVRGAFESADSAATRRRLVHAYLTAPVADTTLLAALRAELPLILDDGQRVRASCELAATYRKFGDLAAFEELRPKVGKSTEDSNPRFPEGAPKPAGACAHWMSVAGAPELGAQFIESVYGPMRKTLNDRNGMPTGSQAHWLKELALVQFESERGEMFDDDWKSPPR